MSNKPWEKWYWKDWLSDTELQSASPTSRGIWVNVLGRMWQTGASELKLSTGQLARLAGCTEAELEQFVAEAQALLFCYASRDHNGEITVMSRRRHREEKGRKNNAERQRRHRSNAKSNAQNNGVDPDPDPDPEEESSSEDTTTRDFSPEKVTRDRCPFSDIVELYHEVLVPPLPAVEKLTETRRGFIRQRWQEDLPSLDHWRNYFAHVKQSSFLMGKAQPSNGSRKPFRASLEWLTRPSNFAKVAEEQYH